MVGLKGAWYLGLVSTVRRGNNNIMHSSASSCGEGRGVRDAYGMASPHTAAHSETNSLGSGVPGMTTLRCTYSWFTRVSRKQRSTLHCAIEKYHITQYVHVWKETPVSSQKHQSKGSNNAFVILLCIERRHLHCIHQRSPETPTFFLYSKKSGIFCSMWWLRFLRKNWVYQ